MTTELDIVERLRRVAPTELYIAQIPGFTWANELCVEAADEITSLRTALAEEKERAEDLMIMVHGETEKVAALTAQLSQALEALKIISEWSCLGNAERGMINSYITTLKGKDHGKEG